MCVRVFHACPDHMYVYNDSMISLCLSGGAFHMFTSYYAVYHPCSLLRSLLHVFSLLLLLLSLCLSLVVKDKLQAAERKLTSLQVKCDSLRSLTIQGRRKQ